MRALEAITSFTPTPSESALVDRIFSIAGAQNSGSILPEAAHHILLGARLPYDTLQEIWDVANVEENATYGKYCIGIAVRLVGHVQNGAELSEELVTSGTSSVFHVNYVRAHVLQAGPIATIEGLEPGRGPSAYSSVTSPRRSGPSSPPPASLSRPPMPNALSNLPPLTDQDRNKFMKIFQKSGQENNVLSGKYLYACGTQAFNLLRIQGPRAREVLMKSRLPMETLGQIWSDRCSIVKSCSRLTHVNQGPGGYRISRASRCPRLHDCNVLGTSLHVWSSNLDPPTSSSVALRSGSTVISSSNP